MSVEGATLAVAIFGIGGLIGQLVSGILSAINILLNITADILVRLEVHWVSGCTTATSAGKRI